MKQGTQLNTNFLLKAELPNFDRDVIETLEELKNPEIEGNYTKGHIVYCAEDDSYYRYTAEFSEDYGLFRPFFNTQNVLDEELKTEQSIINQNLSKGNVLKDGKWVDGISADEEDITSNGNNLLKLKDRPPKNGMGYVILRKDKSLGEQLTQENTIYEIRYDFNLGGEIVNIPQGCIFKFEGGSIVNGEIRGFYRTVGNGVIDVKTSVISALQKDTIVSENYVYVVNNSDEFLEAIANHNAGSRASTIVLESDVTIEGVNINSDYDIIITSNNRSTMRQSAYDINKSKASGYKSTHWCYPVEEVGNLDMLYDGESRIKWAGETETYFNLTLPQAWDISTNKEASNPDFVLTDDNVYARFPLDSLLIDRLGKSNFSEAECRNFVLTYTSDYVNVWTKVYKISEGFVYFKVPYKNGTFNKYVSGDITKYGIAMRYSLIGVPELSSVSTAYVDKDNILHIPNDIKYVQYVGANTTLVNHSGTGRLIFDNVRINGAFTAIASGNVKLESCEIVNTYNGVYKTYSDDAQWFEVRQSKFVNIGQHAISFTRNNTGGHVKISDNKFSNVGIITHSGYAVYLSVSDSLVYGNTIHNVFTAIVIGNTREYSDREICTAVWRNKIYIDEGFITEKNAIKDYGAIYIFTHQKGVCVLGDGTYVKENLVVNNCPLYTGYGIYLDDGCYNTSVVGNYVYGCVRSLTTRYVSNIEKSNEANRILNNILIGGEVNIGQKTNPNTPVEVGINYILNHNIDNVSLTFTNLNEEQVDNIRIITQFDVHGYMIAVPNNVHAFLIKNVPVWGTYIQTLYALNSNYYNSRVVKMVFSKGANPSKGQQWKITLPSESISVLEYRIRVNAMYQDVDFVVNTEEYNGTSIGTVWQPLYSPSIKKIEIEQTTEHKINVYVTLRDDLVGNTAATGSGINTANITVSTIISATYNNEKNNTFSARIINNLKISAGTFEYSVISYSYNTPTKRTLLVAGANKNEILLGAYSQSIYGSRYSPFLLPVYNKRAADGGLPEQNSITDFYSETDYGLTRTKNGIAYNLDGTKAVSKQGTDRPILTSTDAGFLFFDTSLKRPIWWNGSAWVDAAGANV